MRVSEIFEEKPKQWGLRGDPHLWEDMKKEFADVPVTVSAEAFREKFYEVFERLTNKPLTSEIITYCSTTAQGGMSAGKVSGDFWLETALPLLLCRLEMYHILEINHKYVVWKWDEKQGDVSKLPTDNLWILDKDGQELWNIASFFGKSEMCIMVRLITENQFYFYTFSGIGVMMEINDEIKCVDKKLVR